MNQMKMAVLAAATAAIFCGCETATGAAARPMPARGICAHRGDAAAFPENTVPALESAARKGAAMVEFDVARCRTGELVVMHDPTVDRTTNGKGRIADLSFAEIRALDAGVKKDPKFKGVKVPTFDEAVDCLPKDGIWLNVHAKGDVTAEVARKLKEKGRLHQAFIATTKAGRAAARAAVPEVKTGYMDNPPDGWGHVWTAEETAAYFAGAAADGAQFCQPHYCSFTPAEIARYRATGGKVNFFWLNDPARLQELLDMGVDFPLTDKLDDLLAAWKTCRGTAVAAVGDWAVLTQNCGWLNVTADAAGAVSARVLWGGGSPQPLTGSCAGAALRLKGCTRAHADPAQAQYWEVEATVDGDAMTGVRRQVTGAGAVRAENRFTARRVPRPFCAPSSKWIRYGAPIALFAEGLAGWEALAPHAKNGWTFKDGVLANRVQRGPDGKVAGAHTNLRTKRADFRDFKIEYDVRVPAGCNSGVYLRGLYELQVLDSYGKPLDCHNMAAPYGRITPSCSAEKPAGEWQHVEAVLFARHVTVKLNGRTIVANRPLEGVTGGSLSTDVFAPGPIYLQGDHTDADFRNMVLTPIR